MKKFEKEQILKIHQVLELYRLIDRDATVTRLEAFLLIASSRAGVSPSDLCRLMDAEKSHVSLILAQLSNAGRGKRSGLDLVSLVESKDDRRRKFAVLTDKGKELAGHISQILNNDRSLEEGQSNSASIKDKYSHLLLLY